MIPRIDPRALLEQSGLVAKPGISQRFFVEMDREDFYRLYLSARKLRFELSGQLNITVAGVTQEGGYYSGVSPDFVWETVEVSADALSASFDLSAVSRTIAPWVSKFEGNDEWGEPIFSLWGIVYPEYKSSPFASSSSFFGESHPIVFEKPGRFSTSFTTDFPTPEPETETSIDENEGNEAITGYSYRRWEAGADMDFTDNYPATSSGKINVGCVFSFLLEFSTGRKWVAYGEAISPDVPPSRSIASQDDIQASGYINGHTSSFTPDPLQDIPVVLKWGDYSGAPEKTLASEFTLYGNLSTGVTLSNPQLNIIIEEFETWGGLYSSTTGQPV
jgi:hypothetical protein